MLHVALFEPEIPPNTGNIIRLCANVGAKLHLIHPLGFKLDEKSVRRAGLDYHALAGAVEEHADFDTFLKNTSFNRMYACSTKGSVLYTVPQYEDGDCLLFGPETRGLPESIRGHESVGGVIRIPMRDGNRSLNLANSVSVILYEAWRQDGFSEGE